MIGIYLFVGFIFLIVITLKQPAVKGKIGEIIVSGFLKLTLDKTKYHIINNVTIPDDQGGTTQIDHIVISKYGIFIVETKNMRGWIYGDEKSSKWTQVIFKTKNSFQNPLRQNYKHIMCLSQLLMLPEEVFIHLIVFVGNCTLKTKDKLPDNVLPVGISITRFIRSKTTELFDDNTILGIIESVENIRLKRSFKTNREHVNYVKGIVKSKKRDIEQDMNIKLEQSTGNPICRKCGSLMISRIAKRGSNAGNKFWGCSNYPKCKKVLKIS